MQIASRFDTLALRLQMQHRCKFRSATYRVDSRHNLDFVSPPMILMDQCSHLAKLQSGGTITRPLFRPVKMLTAALALHGYM